MKMSEFLSEDFWFLVVKFSIYLNRFVFVMNFSISNNHNKQPETFKLEMDRSKVIVEESGWHKWV